MALVVILGACGDDPEAPVQRTLTVFAAASLVEAFEELAAELERRDTTLDVRLNVAGSQQLAAQLVRGAVADVFAAADREAMQFAAGRGLVLEPQVFAHNRLVVVAARQPAVDVMLVDLLNLATPGLKLVLAAPEVPAGRYAREALRNLSRAPGYGPDFADRVLGNVVSDEVNVRSVLTKVRLGEAHAGIVYASDVSGPDSIARREGIRVIPIPAAFGVRAEYVIARLRTVGDSAGADAFLQLVLGAQGQAVLERYGFQGAEPGQ